LEEDSAPYEVLGIMVGHQYRKVDLEDALSRLLSTGWYEIVNMQWVAHSRGGIILIVTVKDATYSKVSSFQCINISPRLLTGAISETTRLRKRIVSPCLLPGCIQQEITTTLQKCKEVSKSTLYDIQERIENWYHNKGYTYAKVKSFQNSEAGVLECHVDEGVITDVSVSCEDDWQQPTHCNTGTLYRYSTHTISFFLHDINP
jgi:outer membrane protein assembly factor BamA